MSPRGGAREGAGAKPKAPEDKAKRQTFALRPATLAAIRELADAEGVSQAVLIDRAVTAYREVRSSPPSS